MEQPEVRIRILDLDGNRLTRSERLVRRAIREYGIAATVTCIGCGLEISRQGFSNTLPVLLMNQYVASEGRELDEDAVQAFCEKLLRWITLRQQMAEA